MSDLTGYQNVFRVAKSSSNGTEQRGRDSAKRNRNPVSCIPCRTRKLKCDRQLPCSSCSSRDDGSACNYINNGSAVRSLASQGSRSSEARLRLQRLEDVVTDLIQNGTRSDREDMDQLPGTKVNETRLPTTDITYSASSETSSWGHLDIIGSETQYLGPTHWTTILEDIHEIKSYLNPEEDIGVEDLPSSDTSNEPDFWLDTTTTLTLDNVRASLPTRIVADKLLSIYFNAQYLRLPVLHSGKFRREYDMFWNEPSSLSFLWISILFSTMCVASLMFEASGHGVIDSPDSTKSASTLFATRAAQALVAGKYQNARPYSVEALLLYAQCKYMHSEDPDAATWNILGLATRLSMKMGYHRDPKYLLNVSAFDGEIRRRVWFVIEIFDLLLSFQAGLPSMVHEEECDTESPTHLIDEDFDENCPRLPPPRSTTDPTWMLYYSFKSRMVRYFRRAVRHVHSLKAPPYTDTLRIDQELREVHAETPPSLQVRALGSSITDQPYTIMNRVNLDLLYLKSLCVLHRKYLTYDRVEEAYAYSRKTCVDAAVAILNHQADLHHASQPGGQLYDDRWMLLSLTLHDFLLAAMILCLDLYETRVQKPTRLEGLEADDQKYNTLKTSYHIWVQRRDTSRDARRASDILNVMLSKVQGSYLSTIEKGSSFASEGARIGSDNTAGTSTEFPTTRAATIDMSNGNFDKDAGWDVSVLDPLESILNESENLDWGLVDQYLLDRGTVDDLLIWQPTHK